MPTTDESTFSDVVSRDDPRALIWDLIRGQWRFSALYAFVELDLAGRLAEAPATAAQLAERSGVDEMAVSRLLRTCASLGLVETAARDGGAQVYALTAAGETLREEVPRSMRSVVIPQGTPAFLEAMSSLAGAVREGRSAFAQRYGSFYGYLQGDPETRRHFDAHMRTRSRSIAEAVVAAYDFDGIQQIADIGAGVGTILAAVLTANPAAKGLLFELDTVIEGAREYLTAEGVADRCSFVVGDFFEGVPEADAYLVSNIVHNWADDDALRLLHNLRRSLRPGGRILLLDMLLPEDDRPHLGKELDMRLLALYPGGRERGREEYLRLLGSAGLRPTKVVDLPYALSLIETYPESEV